VLDINTTSTDEVRSSEETITTGMQTKTEDYLAIKCEAERNYSECAILQKPHIARALVNDSFSKVKVNALELMFIAEYMF
jgi:hypothetical protein